MTSLQAAGHLLQSVMQRLALLFLVALALGLLFYTAACALGLAPWLVMPLSFGATEVPEGGIWVQSAVTAICMGILFFLPANARILALETSHRRFHMGMKDVARAYAAAHRADREGVFRMSSEFDSVRERIAFLRDHPDLAELEPSVLEVAAQMSHISRELARTYSDSNIQRARDFLTARQQEIEDFNLRLDEAKHIANDMRRWHMQVSLEEDVAEAQLARLCEELEEILPELTPEPAPEPEQIAPPKDAHIIAMLSRRAAE